MELQVIGSVVVAQVTNIRTFTFFKQVPIIKTYVSISRCYKLVTMSLKARKIRALRKAISHMYDKTIVRFQVDQLQVFQEWFPSIIPGLSLVCPFPDFWFVKHSVRRNVAVRYPKPIFMKNTGLILKSTIIPNFAGFV